MGRAKQDQIGHQERVQFAVGLCIEIDAIERCELHDDQLIDRVVYDSPEEVVAEILRQKPDALNRFESSADMLDCVTDALNNAGTECVNCEDDHDS